MGPGNTSARKIYDSCLSRIAIARNYHDFFLARISMARNLARSLYIKAINFTTWHDFINFYVSPGTSMVHYLTIFFWPAQLRLAAAMNHYFSPTNPSRGQITIFAPPGSRRKKKSCPGPSFLNTTQKTVKILKQKGFLRSIQDVSNWFK